jgi:hypothetical protein
MIERYDMRKNRETMVSFDGNDLMEQEKIIGDEDKGEAFTIWKYQLRANSKQSTR